MGIITQGSFPRLMRPGLFGTFGLGYKRYPQEWEDIFEHATSSMNYEEMQSLTGMGYAKVKASGASTEFDDIKQFFPVRFNHLIYSLGMVITKEEIDDNSYLSVGTMRSEGLGIAHSQTKNLNAAQIFNYAFDATTQPVGDGKAFLATDHPTEAGVRSNKLTVDADLAEKPIEDLLVQIYDARDTRGLKMGLRERMLIVPSDQQFAATRYLKGYERPDTADRDINALNVMGKFPDGIKIMHYLTSAKAWFVLTDCPNGLKYFERHPLVFFDDNEFATRNARYATYERYVHGVADYMCLYGSAGA